MSNSHPPTHKEKVDKLLSTYRGIGQAVEDFTGLSGIYPKIRYMEASHIGTLPSFIEEAFGGAPLHTLPSYKFETSQAIVPSAGIGLAMDEAHREMRNLGSRLSRFVLGGSHAAMTAEGNLRDSMRHVANGKEIPLFDKEGKESGKVLRIPGDLMQNMVMLGGISKKFMGRAKGEESLLDDALGNAGDVYDRMGTLLDRLWKEIDSQGVQDYIDAKPLLLNARKIRQAITQELPHFRDMRVLVQIANHGIIPESLCDLCDLQKDKRVHIENPKDAACALFAMSHFADRHVSAETKAIAAEQSERLASAVNNAEAVSLLRTETYQHTLAVLTEKFCPPYSNVLSATMEGLKAFQDNYKVRKEQSGLPQNRSHQTTPHTGI